MCSKLIILCDINPVNPTCLLTFAVCLSRIFKSFLGDQMLEKSFKLKNVVEKSEREL